MMVPVRLFFFVFFFVSFVKFMRKREDEDDIHISQAEIPEKKGGSFDHQWLLNQ
jgi:hypothetical protein